MKQINGVATLVAYNKAKNTTKVAPLKDII